MTITLIIKLEQIDTYSSFNAYIILKNIMFIKYYLNFKIIKYFFFIKKLFKQIFKVN